MALIHEMLGKMNILWGSFWQLGSDIQKLTARALMQVPELFVLLKDPVESPLPNLSDFYVTSSSHRLGSGSFGTVLLMQPKRPPAPDGEEHAEHAVKVVSLSRLPRQADEEALRCEIATLMDLRHKHIVRMVGIYKHGGQLPDGSSDGSCGEPPYICIAMPRIDGRPLSSFLKASLEATAPPTPTRLRIEGFPLARALAPQLFAALAYMHQEGICHRDVWPDNLLVSDALVVTIIDLGCASYFVDGLCNDSGARQLNLNYASPEVYETHAVQLQNWPGSPQQDCWAAGLVLAEVVEGCLVSAFLGNSTPVQEGSSLHQLFLQHLEDIQANYGKLIEPLPEIRMSMQEAHLSWTQHEGRVLVQTGTGVLVDATKTTIETPPFANRPAVSPGAGANRYAPVGAAHAAVDRLALLKREGTLLQSGSSHKGELANVLANSTLENRPLDIEASLDALAATGEVPPAVLRALDLSEGALVWYRPRSQEHQGSDLPGKILEKDAKNSCWRVQIYDYSGRLLPEKHVPFDERLRLMPRGFYLEHEQAPKEFVSQPIQDGSRRVVTPIAETVQRPLPYPAGAGNQEGDDCAHLKEGIAIWYKSRSSSELKPGFVIKNDGARGHCVVQLQDRGVMLERLVCHGDRTSLIPRLPDSAGVEQQVNGDGCSRHAAFPFSFTNRTDRRDASKVHAGTFASRVIDKIELTSSQTARREFGVEDQQTVGAFGTAPRLEGTSPRPSRLKHMSPLRGPARVSRSPGFDGPSRQQRGDLTAGYPQTSSTPAKPWSPPLLMQSASTSDVVQSPRPSSSPRKRLQQRVPVTQAKQAFTPRRSEPSVDAPRHVTPRSVEVRVRNAGRSLTPQRAQATPRSSYPVAPAWGRSPTSPLSTDQQSPAHFTPQPWQPVDAGLALRHRNSFGQRRASLATPTRVRPSSPPPLQACLDASAPLSLDASSCVQSPRQLSPRQQSPLRQIPGHMSMEHTPRDWRAQVIPRTDHVFVPATTPRASRLLASPVRTDPWSPREPILSGSWRAEAV